MTKDSKKRKYNLTIPRSILITGKILSFISSGLLTRFAVKLFTTPIRHKMPKRELTMDINSHQELIMIPEIGKKVMVYKYGKGNKRILLVHGWSGRGTQLSAIADELLKQGYATVSFDAPAHGKSPGKTTLMPEFIATIKQLEKEFGPFEAAVGHSLGGMSLLNSTKQGLQLKKLITIGSGDIIKDILNDFVGKLQLKPKLSDWMENHFNQRNAQSMSSYSAYIAAKEIKIPVLVIHDQNDEEVPVSCAFHINNYLQNGELVITEGLGHRKILGDAAVVRKVVKFIRD